MENIKKKRIGSIDILRGLVILIMLVDHLREHFFSHHPVVDPMLIQETNASLFFTRLSAHLCAPIFVFLTGLSAWLYSNPNERPKRSATAFLLKRGIFLIFLEITLINFSWSGSYNTLYLQVIWVIGLSMISLAFLSKLPRVWIGIIGFAIVFGHNLLTPITFEKTELGYNLWTILHDRGYLEIDGLLKTRISYPVLPWIGVILLGYFMGPLYRHSQLAKKRQNILLTIGFSSLTLLLVLRGGNVYGETMPWEPQNSFIETTMSFLNFTKYPPSLDFLLLTIGIGLLLLYYFEKYHSKFAEILKVFGSAPMFFYIVHLYALLLIHGLLMFLVNNGQIVKFNNIYQIWLMSFALSILLYYPTKKFSRYKHQSKSKLIKYF